MDNNTGAAAAGMRKSKDATLTSSEMANSTVVDSAKGSTVNNNER